ESDGRSSFPQVAVSRPTMKSGLRPKISPDALSYLPPVLGQNARHRTTLSDSRSASDSSPSLRTTSALARTASLSMRADKPRGAPQPANPRAQDHIPDNLGSEVTGAATKSSSPVSRRTKAGRTFEPGAW